MTTDLGLALTILAIYVLALARLTRLINADTILDRPRLSIEARRREVETIVDREIELGRDPETVAYWQRREHRWATAFYFVQCPWCVGMWLALASAWLPVRLLSWPWWASLPVALAASHLIGVCARFADTEEITIEDDTATG